MFLLTKRFVAAAKILVEATKNSFVVPDFVAVTKPFFPCIRSTVFVAKERARLFEGQHRVVSVSVTKLRRLSPLNGSYNLRMVDGKDCTMLLSMRSPFPADNEQDPNRAR